MILTFSSFLLFHQSSNYVSARVKLNSTGALECASRPPTCIGLWSSTLRGLLTTLNHFQSILEVILVKLKGTPRYRARVPVIMTHRKVRICDKNAHLAFVPSEGPRQVDSYSVSHSWPPTTDVVCATSPSRVPIERSLANNQKFVQKSGVRLWFSITWGFKQVQYLKHIITKNGSKASACWSV